MNVVVRDTTVLNRFGGSIGLQATAIGADFSSALRHDVTSGNAPPSLYVFNAAAITQPHAVEHLTADMMG